MGVVGVGDTAAVVDELDVDAVVVDVVVVRVVVDAVVVVAVVLVVVVEGRVVVAVVVVVIGDAAPCAGTTTDCTIGFIQERGRMAKTVPVPIALNSGRRSGSSLTTIAPRLRICVPKISGKGQAGRQS